VAVFDCSLSFELFPLCPKGFYTQHPQKKKIDPSCSLAPTPGWYNFNRLRIVSRIVAIDSDAESILGYARIAVSTDWFIPRIAESGDWCGIASKWVASFLLKSLFS
jgi:hypothetical protein